MEQLLLTIPECCRLASIGRTKFYELIATGEIPIRKIGRKTREGRPPCQGSLLGLASCRWPRLDRGKPFDPISQVRSRDQRGAPDSSAYFGLPLIAAGSRAQRLNGWVASERRYSEAVRPTFAN